MKSVLFVHDSYSSSSEPWIVAVSDELKVRGFSVYAPKFPTPIGQDYISWKVMFDSYAGYITSDTILVGAGVGCAFILRYLTEHPAVVVAKTIFIAPFITPIANPSEQLLAQSFLLPAFDATLLRRQMGLVDVVVSDNDLLVDESTSKYVADLFAARITRLQGKGHFRAVNGVRLMPELIDVIELSRPLSAAIATAPIAVALDSAPIISTPAPMPSIAPVAKTDVAALEKLLAELSARNIAPVNNTMPAAPIQPESAPAVSMNNSAANTGAMPALTSNIPLVEAEVQTSAPVSSGVGVMHSLVNDFSTSLINADAKEVSKTLNDYRQGRQYAGQEKKMTVFRTIAAVIGVILLLAAGYFAYRVYFFNETLPTIRNLIIAPLDAVDTQSVSVDRAATPPQAVSKISENLAELSLSAEGDIGVLEITDQNKEKIPAEAVIRLVGGTTPSTIYTKLDAFYAIGAVRDVAGFSPFMLFALSRPEAETVAELTNWEEWMAQDLVPLFAAGVDISPATHTFAFEDRKLENRDIRVLVATRKTDDAATLSAGEPEADVLLRTEMPDLTVPVIGKNGVPDTSTPVLPLTATIGTPVDVVDTRAETIAEQATAQATAAPTSSEAVTTEKNKIDLFKISSSDQTAITRSRNKLTIAANSPLFDLGILPGDIFAFESRDKEDVADIDAESNTAIVPILGGTPVLVQITEILQLGTKTDLIVKPIELSEAIALVDQEVISNILPNGASVLAQPVAVTTDVTDVFSYSIVNGKVLIFATDADDIDDLAQAYFNQKKSIFDMFR